MAPPRKMERRDDLRRLVRQYPHTTVMELAAALGVTRQWVKRLLQSEGLSVAPQRIHRESAVVSSGREPASTQETEVA